MELNRYISSFECEGCGDITSNVALVVIEQCYMNDCYACKRDYCRNNKTKVYCIDKCTFNKMPLYGYIIDSIQHGKKN